MLEYPEQSAQWHKDSNTIVVLAVQDERALQNVEEGLKILGMEHISFKEPDIGNELTAIAILPSEQAKSFCKHFKLAFSPVAQFGRAGGSNPLDVGSNPAGGTMVVCTSESARSRA